MSRPRHFQTNAAALKRAQTLRANMTPEELLLWSYLKHFRQQGFAFRRQAPIGPFVVDFLCRKAMLIVEVDGNHHGADDEQFDHDIERDAWLREHGYRVLRFWNADVRQDLDGVIDDIFSALRATS